MSQTQGSGDRQKWSIDCDSALVYLIDGAAKDHSRWVIELTDAEHADLKRAEEAFWNWQQRLREHG